MRSARNFQQTATEFPHGDPAGSNAESSLRHLVTPLGRLAGKRHISERPVSVERRHHFKTITADNGTEFHEYSKVERATGVRFYFATPYRSWERGSNENLNGLIRQYLPKRRSMAAIIEHDCNAIAKKLNARPRKMFDRLARGAGVRAFFASHRMLNPTTASLLRETCAGVASIHDVCLPSLRFASRRIESLPINQRSDAALNSVGGVSPMRGLHNRPTLHNGTTTLTLLLAMLGFATAAQAKPGPPKLYSASLILHSFANDATGAL